MAVLAERSTDGPDEGPQARGSEVQATRDREGEAGHSVRGSGHTWEGRVPESVSTKLHRITEQARRDPGFVFTNLMHLVDEVFLWEAHRQIRKGGATGVDGVTAEEYAKDLAGNLRRLHQTLRSGRYKAPPVKRGWVPKDDGKQRPIGITAFEDKIVQRAGAMILGAIYEVDFSDGSYGFRPGRSAHQALQALRQKCLWLGTVVVIDADIRGYFDTINHRHLREMLRRRINDGALLRLINRWLKAGVMEGERLSHPRDGTPQGGVISPVLANIYLHEVLDRWFQEEVQPRLDGRSFFVRYADDFILGFANDADARRVMAVLPKRFGRFALTVHPDKTRRLRFGPPGNGEDRETGSFDFLGFTHYWGQTRGGGWTIKRRTSRKRLTRSMKRAWQWCRENLHEPIRWQWKTLVGKLRGHYNYYGIRGNYKQMEALYEHACASWRHWLNRRSSKGRRSSAAFDKLLESWPLPLPRIVHAV